VDDVAPLSFEAYVAARWTRLVRAAVLLGSDVHSAEDLVQTALVRCYRAWGRVTRADDPDAYVHRALINSQVESRRRRWWGESPTLTLPEDAGGADGSVRFDQRDQVRAALMRLPLGQRQVVVLRFYADLTELQTADALGIALGTVKSRTSRAFVALAADPELSEFSIGGTHE
jgi:RNA polymerase sigma-70 factor (sigma-E family)